MKYNLSQIIWPRVFEYKISSSREKFEPEPGFEFSDLRICSPALDHLSYPGSGGPSSSPGSGSNFSHEILLCKFPKAQIMSLFSINNLI